LVKFWAETWLSTETFLPRLIPIGFPGISLQQRINPMGLTILAGGCRYMTDTGKIEEKYCDQCPVQGSCEIEPHAREIAAILSRQWVRTDFVLPPKARLVLYLEYPSNVPSGTVYCGYYDRRRHQYIEQGSGKTLPAERIIAWMGLPEVPKEIYPAQRAANRACLD
jgi:hypothetical protein